jgi:hypothetical protein
VLDPIPDQGADLNHTVTITAHATDPDSPPETLTYSLVPGAPAPIHINPVTGAITFTPTKFGTFTFTVRVTDNGTPSLSDARAFRILVPPQLNSVVLNDGSIKHPSQVSFLTVTFNSRVMIDAGAFELLRSGPGGGSVGVLVASTTVVNLRTVLTLRFTAGPFVQSNGALVGGNYVLTTHDIRIHDAITGLALDGDSNGTPGGDNLHSFTVTTTGGMPSRLVDAVDLLFASDPKFHLF